MSAPQSFGHDKRRSVLSGLGLSGVLTTVLLAGVVLQFVYFHTRISVLQTEFHLANAASDQHISTLDVRFKKLTDAASTQSAKLLADMHEDCRTAVGEEAALRVGTVAKLERVLQALGAEAAHNSTTAVRVHALVLQAVASIKVVDAHVAQLQAGGERATALAEQSTRLAHAALDAVRNLTVHSQLQASQLAGLHAGLAARSVDSDNSTAASSAVPPVLPVPGGSGGAAAAAAEGGTMAAQHSGARALLRPAEELLVGAGAAAGGAANGTTAAAAAADDSSLSAMGVLTGKQAELPTPRADAAAAGGAVHSATAAAATAAVNVTATAGSPAAAQGNAAKAAFNSFASTSSGPSADDEAGAGEELGVGAGWWDKPKIAGNSTVVAVNGTAFTGNGTASNGTASATGNGTAAAAVVAAGNGTTNGTTAFMSLAVRGAAFAEDSHLLASGALDHSTSDPTSTVLPTMHSGQIAEGGGNSSALSAGPAASKRVSRQPYDRRAAAGGVSDGGGGQNNSSVEADLPTSTAGAAGRSEGRSAQPRRTGSALYLRGEGRAAAAANRTLGDKPFSGGGAVSTAQGSSLASMLQSTARGGGEAQGADGEGMAGEDDAFDTEGGVAVGAGASGNGSGGETLAAALPKAVVAAVKSKSHHSLDSLHDLLSSTVSETVVSGVQSGAGVGGVRSGAGVGGSGAGRGAASATLLAAAAQAGGSGVGAGGGRAGAGRQGIQAVAGSAGGL